MARTEQNEIFQPMTYNKFIGMRVTRIDKCSCVLKSATTDDPVEYHMHRLAFNKAVSLGTQCPLFTEIRNDNTWIVTPGLRG